MSEPVAEPDLAGAAWNEITPGVWYNPARLPDAAVAEGMLKLVRKFLRPLPVKLEGIGGYLAAVHKNEKYYIVHLLAKDYDTDIDHRLDEIRTHRTRVNLITKVEPLNVSREFTVETELPVEVYTPFNDEGATWERRGGAVRVELPDKCSYAVVRIAVK